MDERIEKMMEISKYLGDNDSVAVLKRISNSLDEKTCYLSFMGQFSAGKSRLINNLLKRDILPVHTTETTALPTYIFYGTEESAGVFYNDGSYEELTIDDTLEMWQSGIKSEKLAEIDSIRLTVDSQILKNGLVIIDTPGINTIIENHVERTESIISNSDRVVYVLGKPLTGSDERFINMLADNGIQLLFVRTKMDELRVNEETPEVAVSKERDILAPLTSDSIFFVSNEENNRFSSNIDELRNYISDHVAGDIERSIADISNSKLRYIAARQENKVLDKKETLAVALSDSREEYEKRIEEIKKSLTALEDILAENKKKLAENYEKQRQNSVDELDNEKKSELDRICKKINGAGESFNYSVEVPELVHISLLNIQNRYMASFDRFIRDNKNEFMKEIKSSINNSTDIPDISELPGNLEEANSQIDYITSKISALYELKKSLSEQQRELESMSSKNSDEYQKLMQEAEELHQVVEEIQECLDEYPPYVTRYKMLEGDHRCEKRLRTIGNVADWATILIPGPTWAKAGAKVLNVGAKGAKAVKAVNVADAFLDGARVLAKIGKGTNVAKATKSAKKLKNIDKAIGAVRVIGNAKKVAMQQKYPQQYENIIIKSEAPINLDNLDESVFDPELPLEPKTSILDYIGLDYWFGKIGKKFDTLDVKVVDEKYRSEYIAGKRKIEIELKKQADREWELVSQAETFKDEQEKLKRKSEIYSRKDKRVDDQLTELKKQLEDEKKKAVLKLTKTHYSDAAEYRIDRFVEHLKADIQPQIDEKMEKYINLYDFRIGSDIIMKRKQLESVEKEYDSSDRTNLEKELAIVTGYAIYLDGIIGK